MPSGEHADFGARLTETCDNTPGIPPLHQGRLTWFVREFQERYDYKVSKESVRRWFEGLARPRPSRFDHLCEILKVDPAWLGYGAVNSRVGASAPAAAINGDGAANILLGLLIGSELPVAQSDEKGVDLAGIYRGRLSRIVVRSPVDEGDEKRVYLPENFENSNLILVERSELSAHVFFVPRDALENQLTSYGAGKTFTLKSGGGKIKVGDVALSPLERIAQLGDLLD